MNQLGSKAYRGFILLLLHRRCQISISRYQTYKTSAGSFLLADSIDLAHISVAVFFLCGDSSFGR